MQPAGPAAITSPVLTPDITCHVGPLCRLCSLSAGHIWTEGSAQWSPSVQSRLWPGRPAVTGAATRGQLRLQQLGDARVHRVRGTGAAVGVTLALSASGVPAAAMGDAGVVRVRGTGAAMGDAGVCPRPGHRGGGGVTLAYVRVRASGGGVTVAYVRVRGTGVTVAYVRVRGADGGVGVTVAYVRARGTAGGGGVTLAYVRVWGTGRRWVPAVPGRRSEGGVGRFPWRRR
jgi:hypothetical protein